MIDILWLIIEWGTNLFQSFLCIHFIIVSFDNKCKILNAKKVHIIGTLFMTTVVTLLNYITIYEGLLGVIYSMCFFLFAYIFLHGSILKKIFISVFTNICLIVAATIVSNLLLSFIKNDLSYIYTEQCLERLLYMIITTALIAYIFAISKRFTSGKKESLKIKEWILILSVLGISFFIVAIMQITILDAEIDKEKLNLLMASELGIILINILCLYITVSLNETHKREEQLIIDKRRSEYGQQYAQTIKEQYEQTRRLRHDMKQYASAMQALIKGGKLTEAEELAEQQTESLSRIETVINVNNDFLNAILNSKLSFAKSKGIDVLCSIENDISGIDDIDLCNLIGNLLDNAILAAEKCDPESRLIEIKISSAGSRLVMIVRNSICDSVLRENPELKSTKADSFEHGFGIKTIKYIAEKYNGKFDYYEEGLIFISRMELQKEKI